MQKKHFPLIFRPFPLLISYTLILICVNVIKGKVYDQDIRESREGDGMWDKMYKILDQVVDNRNKLTALGQDATCDEEKQFKYDLIFDILPTIDKVSYYRLEEVLSLLEGAKTSTDLAVGSGVLLCDFENSKMECVSGRCQCFKEDMDIVDFKDLEDPEHATTFDGKKECIFKAGKNCSSSNVKCSDGYECGLKDKNGVWFTCSVENVSTKCSDEENYPTSTNAPPNPQKLSHACCSCVNSSLITIEDDYLTDSYSHEIFSMSFSVLFPVIIFLRNII